MASTVNRPVVRFDGLRELDRALGKADKDLRAVLRADLKDAAQVVATRAIDIAEEKGLVRSGDMVRRIAPFALVRGAGVRSSSRHRGYAYPRRLEFEGRDGDEYGPRASLLPALDQERDAVYEKAEALLDLLMVDLST